MSIEVTGTTITFNGVEVRISNRQVYLRAFGTTAQNQSMHWSWIQVPVDKLKKELQDYLKDNNLVD